MLIDRGLSGQYLMSLRCARFDRAQRRPFDKAQDRLAEVTGPWA